MKFWYIFKTYRHPALLQIESHRQRLAHKHIGIVIRGKGALQLLQLPRAEVGARPAALRRVAVVFAVGGGACGRTQNNTPIS